jgi:hypothetical protein
MNHLEKNDKISAWLPLVILVPFVAMGAAYGWLAYLQRGLYENWERYSEFWGGNPSEVFSHWLDVVLMTGGAVVMTWLLVAETLYRTDESQALRVHRSFRICLGAFLFVNGLVGIVLDISHGEGTVVFVYLIFFLPMLVSTWYLMRRCASFLRWHPVGTAMLGLAVVAFHAVAQWYYEPSGSGAPNMFVTFIWLGCVGMALGWALVRSIRTGSLVRVCSRCLRIMRRPVVYGGMIVVLSVLAGPPALYAWHIRKTKQAIVYPLLDEVEAALTDDFVAGLKRDHTSSTLEKIPLSPSAQRLLQKIKSGNTLRIFIPVNRHDHLFLMGDHDSQYCNIRRIARGQTEQMDQGFLDALMADGGTRQSGLFAMYWSPYIAGRVLKDETGDVKAIYVINGPRS